MRSSILLLAAASLLAAAQAAPVSSEDQATSTPDFAHKCSKESDGTWFCYGEHGVNPKAASIDFRTGDCLKIKNKWVCPGKSLVSGAEPKAASVGPEGLYSRSEPQISA
ncbi:MAG: hypothetical protein J3R72DRAFT_449439 [Linnemannia gamsii]|nr:MAG: hypothetical protein J3R72DRAFT_449439 [Linnemannia gamsii]